MRMVFFKRSRACSIHFIIGILISLLFLFDGKYAYSQDAKLSQITLLVDNIQRSVDFYQRLGFSISYQKNSSLADGRNSIAHEKYPLTSDPKSELYVIMSDASKEGTNIALLAYEKPPLADARGNLMGLGVGDFVLVINTEDINFLYNRMDEFGARFYRRIQRVENNDLSENVIMYNFIVYDPDGHLVEVISRINNS